MTYPKETVDESGLDEEDHDVVDFGFAVELSWGDHKQSAMFPKTK